MEKSLHFYSLYDIDPNKKATELNKVEFLFDSIIEQISVQPDNMWSCRARMAFIRIFDYLKDRPYDLSLVHFCV